MAELIIGDTTHDSAKIWIRGEKTHPFARVSLQANDRPILSGVVPLSPAHDFIEVVPFAQLQPGTSYRVRAHFGAAPARLGDGSAPVEGDLRTFPDPDRDGEQPFGFLHGSCNLSIVSLTNLGALATGFAATLAGRQSRLSPRIGSRFWEGVLCVLDGLARAGYWVAQVLRPLLEKVRPRVAPPEPSDGPETQRRVTIVDALFYVLYQRSRFKQPKPLLPSPFAVLSRQIEADPPAFMIHAGDQIYFDVPEAKRSPKLEEYRLAYREAWFGDEGARRFLRTCPQYMTLDDHDIVDGFAGVGSNGDPRMRKYLDAATAAYREYVHSRQPSEGAGALYYRFRYGSAHFFVLDTRTERDVAKQQMIGQTQMDALLGWLEHHRDELKFVVSSVPFVAEVRSEKRSQRGERDEREEREDKWCGRSFRRQREKIIEFLLEKEIGKLVFLVGDMHCAYHTRMRIGEPERRVTLHELAGGPIYQLQFSRRQEFLAEYRATTAGGVPYQSWLGTFYGSASGVLSIEVSPGRSPEVRWRLIRTSPRFEKLDTEKYPRWPRDVSGRIRF